MPIDDLQGAIACVRDACFYEDELEQFERIVDRLEGYDLAYSVILKCHDELEKEVKILKNQLAHADNYSNEIEDERQFWNEVCDYMELHKCTKKIATKKVCEIWEEKAVN